MPQPRCSATRPDGSPCRSFATKSGLCIQHDPLLEAERVAARRRGGHGRSNTARATKAAKLIGTQGGGVAFAPLADNLNALLKELHTGKTDPRTATAMASVAGVLLRVVTAADTEERLRALEGRLLDVDARKPK